MDRGPTTVPLTVRTQVQAATTTMHWHGMLQVGTVDADGVPGMTQCLIPPGGTVVYFFRASLSGTYWYHGHHSDQYVVSLVVDVPFQ